MKKSSILLTILLGMSMMLAGCQGVSSKMKSENPSDMASDGTRIEGATQIVLSDEDILVDGEVISTNEKDAVYMANDIIFYLEGQGIEYGEGTAKDGHSQTEADAHTVIHITEPGTYEISGTLSAGQILVDLGDGAKKDEEAVVTLALNNVNLSCNVAPAILFLNVYECGDDDADEAAMDVDLTGAGANIYLVDDSVNNITGSYVAKIYESCELNEDGTKVVESKKLWKFDGAVYSRRSMNVYGDTGCLNIAAANEGLDTELHLAIHGGYINIDSGNDGINVNEDNVSVFIMNGGNLDIKVNGSSGEGDGIDSNGWLVINGGYVSASACGTSQDSGIDSELGIHINGGTVIASGNMMDRIEDSGQNHITFMVREGLKGGEIYQLKDMDGNLITDIVRENDCQMLVISMENLEKDMAYTLWSGETQVAESSSGGMRGGSGGMGGPGGNPGGDMRPDDGQMPDNGMMPGGGRGQRPDGQMPEGEPGEMPEGMEPPGGFEPGQEPPAKPEELEQS